MKMYELGTIIIVTVVSICIAAGLLSRIWLGPDNIVEQEAEKIIEEETGIHIDLSPDINKPVV